MSGGYFELAPEQVLLLRVPTTTAQVQAIQLTDMWFASLEHGNQVSSLTTKQSLLSEDGTYYFVISAEEPGHANWLDTGGLRRGIFLLRWDGVRGALREEEYPQAEVVDRSSLTRHIPALVHVQPETRRETRKRRRRHLQQRTHR